jgi:Raf kinase inhibitor-like YbhB/YbcL family protein
MAFYLESAAFQNDRAIPARYTGEGDDLSPPLRWSGAPLATRQFALIVDDPDAVGNRDFVHWVAYGIPGSQHHLPEGLAAQGQLSDPCPLMQGRNDLGRVGYRGPMPPVGHGIHHYVFKLYALSEEIELDPGASKEELLRAMEGKILDAAQCVGKYERRNIDTVKSA